METDLEEVDPLVCWQVHGLKANRLNAIRLDAERVEGTGRPGVGLVRVDPLTITNHLQRGVGGELEFDIHKQNNSNQERGGGGRGGSMHMCAIVVHALGSDCTSTYHLVSGQ